MKMRLLSTILAIFLLPAFLMGCAANAGIDSDTLTVWVIDLEPKYESILATNPDSYSAKLTKEIVEKFEKDNPGKKLNLSFQGWGESLNSAIMSAITNRTEVDIVPGETYIRKFIEGELFAEIENPGIKEKLVPSILEKGMKDGKMYAVPVWTGSLSLFVNKSVLRQAQIINAADEIAPKYVLAGINPLKPATYEDLLVVCKDIKSYFMNLPTPVTSKGGMIINDVSADSQWRALGFMRPAGGDFVDKDGNIILDTPQNVKAFNMMQELSKTAPSGCYGKSATNENFSYFHSNRIAYMVEGTSLITTSVGTACEGYYTVEELPSYESDNVKSNTSVGTAYYSIMHNSKKKELAAKFIDVLLSDEIQKAMVKYSYKVPSVKAILESEEIKTDEYNYKFLKSSYEPFLNSAYVNVTPLYGFLNNSYHIWEVWDSFTQKIFTKQNSLSAPGGIIKKTQEDMVSALNRK